MIDDTNSTATTREARSRQCDPFVPSWIDAIDHLPGSGWYIYPLVVVVGLVVLQSTIWPEGSVVRGRVTPIELSIAIWTVLPVAVIHVVVGLGLVAALTFLLPLLRVRQRIATEKERVTSGHLGRDEYSAAI